MYVMQVELQFPDDRDMDVLKERFAQDGPETDNAVGLRFKAYLIRERGVHGSPVNEYAPFYVWDDLRGLAYLLWQSGEFSRVLEYFKRPRVEGWIGAGFEYGLGSNRNPTFASRRIVPFAEDTDPRSERGVLLREMNELLGIETVHSVTIGIDPGNWSAVLFVLWTKEPQGDWSHVYTVEHFSMPGIPYEL